jgi:hypothetical protein
MKIFLLSPSGEKSEEKTREAKNSIQMMPKFFFLNEVFPSSSSAREGQRYFVNTREREKRAKETKRDDDFRYFLVQIVRVYIQVWVCSPPRARSFLSLSVSLSLSREPL